MLYLHNRSGINFFRFLSRNFLLWKHRHPRYNL